MVHTSVPQASERFLVEMRRHPMSPNCEEIIPTFGALFPRGGPVQDPSGVYGTLGLPGQDEPASD